MPVIRASQDGKLAIVPAIILTVGLYFLIPAICPGFFKTGCDAYLLFECIET